MVLSEVIHGDFMRSSYYLRRKQTEQNKKPIPGPLCYFVSYFTAVLLFFCHETFIWGLINGSDQSQIVIFKVEHQVKKTLLGNWVFYLEMKDELLKWFKMGFQIANQYFQILVLNSPMWCSFWSLFGFSLIPNTLLTPFSLNVHYHFCETSISLVLNLQT